ncbi:cytochrome c551 peroxidase [Nautilia profundicola AmH]|uniref:Cytochrome c551 peroxidase n=1 Tax=Nautilia profundicola (strain ATCC BAA-1463 / DSM 18972 / AmH) TaxID=598659 RepID=B9L7S3_NAUPA|nr:cytochrome c peroxidase [Nautilia profundicola]ACM93737.1 cytochrome c551 peroxidase [Nautilia profundicola AmH]
MRVLTLFILFVLFLHAQNLIEPIPEYIKYNKQKAELGKFLFFDTILSKDKTVSCASCHNPAEGWADSRKVSIGVSGKKGRIQSPTVLNAVFNFRQFWNGRAKDLKEQINGPVHNSVEMNVNEKIVEKRLNQNRFYKNLFKKVYHTNKITYDMVVDAIAEFEKTLITPNSKFDLYLKGKIKLTPLEEKGYVLFKKYGCVTCHNGVNVGGNSFQKMGTIFPIKECIGDRYEISHAKFDKCIYKVPTLRNVELTAPYFHDGSAKTLEKAVEKMAYNNLGFKINKEDAKAIVAFLKTLTGKIPKIKIMRKE